MRSCKVAQVGFELVGLLAQPPRSWRYRCAPPCPARLTNCWHLRATHHCPFSGLMSCRCASGALTACASGWCFAFPALCRFPPWIVYLFLFLFTGIIYIMFVLKVWLLFMLQIPAYHFRCWDVSVFYLNVAKFIFFIASYLIKPSRPPCSQREYTYFPYFHSFIW